MYVPTAEFIEAGFAGVIDGEGAVVTVDDTLYGGSASGVSSETLYGGTAKVGTLRTGIVLFHKMLKREYFVRGEVEEQNSYMIGIRITIDDMLPDGEYDITFEDIYTGLMRVGNLSSQREAYVRRTSDAVEYNNRVKIYRYKK